MEERSKEKKQCRLCRLPVVDGSVFLPDVDLDKLSEWWSASLGTDLNERTLVEAWCCQQCIWDARLLYEFGTLEPKPDYVWWPLMEDPFYHKYIESDLEEIKEEPAGDLNERNQNTRNFLSVDASLFRKTKVQKKLKCTFRGCAELLETEGALKQHFEKVHKMTSDVAIKCNTCKKTYACKISLSNHMRLKHPEAIKYKNKSHPKVVLAKMRKATQAQTPKTFDCFLCVEKFATKKELAEHIKKNHKNSAIRCKMGRYCNLYFKTKIEMEAHFEKEHQFKCTICPLVSTSKQSLFSHFKKNHKDAIKCGFFHCMFHACSKEEVEKHVEESHDRGKKEKSAECIFCQRRFVDLVHRAAHTRRLHAKIAIQCDHLYCLHFVKHSSELEVHKKEAHSSVVEKHKKSTICLYCNKEVWDNTTYVVHLKQVHPSEVIRCKHHTCFTFFKTKEDLEQHLKERHVSKFVCDFCGHGAARKDYIINHISRYHLPKETRCPECPKMFGSYSELKGHTRYYHQKSENCPHCDEIGTNLSRHIVTAKCPVCNKSFPCKNLLKKHKLSCKMDYRCSFCDRHFRIKSELSHHLNDKHKFGAKWKGYKCRMCEKVFNSLNSLRLHKVENHPSFAKSCALCQKKFWSFDALTRHLAIAHRIGGAECEKCDKRFATKKGYETHLKYNHSKNDPKLQFIECDICKRVLKRSSFKEHLRQLH